jgi:hypothetical protein
MIDIRRMETAPGMVFDASVGGADAAPLVLMLHGFGVSRHLWNAQVTQSGEQQPRGPASSSPHHIGSKFCPAVMPRTRFQIGSTRCCWSISTTTRSDRFAVETGARAQAADVQRSTAAGMLASWALVWKSLSSCC